MPNTSKSQTAGSRRWRRYIGVAAAVSLFCIAACGMIMLQNARLRKIQVYRPYVDSLFLPQVNAVRYMSLGYNLFAADFLYMRSIQAFGGQWRFGMKNYDSISHLFRVMTELDPHFIEAYEFGSMVLGEEAADPERAIELNAQGWTKNPDKYRLPYLNAYMCIWTLDAPLRAKYWIRQAMKAPDAPDFVTRFVQYIDQKQGRYESAMEKNVFDYLKAVQDQNDYVQTILKNKFQLVVDEWNIDLFQKALEKYRTEHNDAMPHDILALLDDRYTSGARVCYYDRFKSIMENLPKELPTDLTELHRKIMSTCIGPIRGMPTAPYATSRYENQYFIRRDDGCYTYQTAFKRKEIVMSMHSARKYITDYPLSPLRSAIRGFRQKQHRYPLTLDELNLGNTPLKDPVTGFWLYNSITGQLSSPTFPNQ